MFVGFLFTLALAARCVLTVPSPVYGDGNGYYNERHGAVSSEVSECSEAGGRLMQRGGNAVDGIITTILCVGTTSGIYHSGIGGGGFALVRSPEGQYEFLDFRETAPALANETMFVNRTGNPSLYGGLAAGVPGEIRGLAELHKRYGRASWKSLFQPSIKYARYGFIVNKDLAAAIVDEAAWIKKDKSWLDILAPNGTLAKEGDMIWRKNFAKTLEAIAKRGPDAFYTGNIAKSTVKTLKARGGIITEKDLKGYKVLNRKPATIDYRGYKLTTGTAPCSGAVALAALNIYEGFKNTKADKGLSLHRLIESTKFAYGMRMELGDPTFLPNMTSYQRSMISGAVAASARGRIQDDRVLVNISDYDLSGLVMLGGRGGTSHMSSIDSSGLAASLTTTINTFFGSRVMDKTTGIVFNNEMDDFSTPGAEKNFFGYPPSPANYIRPGKRPVSSISPAVVELNGRPYFVIGAAGGSRIISTVLQTIVHVIDEGMDAKEALRTPRWHHQLVPTNANVEPGFNLGLVEELRQRGHNVTFGPAKTSAQGITAGPKGFEAEGEPRQGGSGGWVF